MWWRRGKEDCVKEEQIEGSGRELLMEECVGIEMEDT